MSGPTCRDIRLALGVYVVGAIDPSERTIVDIHLSHCPECREELAAMAGLPSLLGRVPARDAERLALDSADLKDLEEPPARVLTSLLSEVAARRKARRWRVVMATAAAAVIAVGGGLVGGIAVSGGPAASQQAGQPETVHAVDARTHVAAAVTYTPSATGTTMAVIATGIPVGTKCDFWVIRTDGRQAIAGHWTVGSWEHQAYRTASSQFKATRIRAFLITTSRGRTLVKVPAS
jgi:anti-sigma factor RsiW